MSTYTSRNRKFAAKPQAWGRDDIDFTRVGGLSEHIEILREIIIFPLLYGDLYSHFNIKVPRGILFHGPPGTGKTLVAGALASEVSREGYGKVNFLVRKGADILDKWVGESERKLRELFEKAARYRPAIIFFDELDGLAPARSQKHDQVHCSVVATLLALMDGLDTVPGVVVIGATNRVDALDPALRRPGRFDKEFYFPLPSTNARKEILQVQVQSWKYKPSTEFLSHLSELTAGFNGADLQALCSDSLICCLKRLYPNIHRRNLTNRINITPENVQVEECDFLTASRSVITCTQRQGSKVRKLSSFIQPLLQRQINKILANLELVWPHFLRPGFKYLIGQERYAGRILLTASPDQGTNMHIIPALLQALEHLPVNVLEIPIIVDKFVRTVRQNLPCVLVMAHIDDWWELLDDTTKIGLTIMLEDLHPGLPVLLLATCSTELPERLQAFFYNYSSIVINVDYPAKEEREEFFAPLFFGKSSSSIQQVLEEKNSTSKMSIAPIQSIIMKQKDPEVKPKASQRKINRRRLKKKPPKRLRGGGLGSIPFTSLKRKYSGSKASDEKIPAVKLITDENQFSGNHTPSTCSSADKEDVIDIGTSSANASTDSIKQYTDGQVHSQSDQNINDINQKCKFHDFAVRDSRCSSLRIPYMKVSHLNERMCKMNDFSTALTDLLNSDTCGELVNMTSRGGKAITTLFANKNMKEDSKIKDIKSNNLGFGDNTDVDKIMVYNLWQRVSHVTSENLPIGRLELLYDTMAACITLNKANFGNLIEQLKLILNNFETSPVENDDH